VRLKLDSITVARLAGRNEFLLTLRSTEPNALESIEFEVSPDQLRAITDALGGFQARYNAQIPPTHKTTGSPTLRVISDD
jgi:hypothetical protein